MLTFTIKKNFQKQLLLHQSSRSMGSTPRRNFLHALTWCLLPRRGDFLSKREILFIVKVVASSMTEQDIPDSYYVIGFLCREEGTILPAQDYLLCPWENGALFSYNNGFLTKLVWLDGWILALFFLWVLRAHWPTHARTCMFAKGRLTPADFLSADKKSSLVG